MSLIQQLSVLAIHQVLGERADSLVRFLNDRLTDHGQRLENALRLSGERTWRCLEVSLAGSSWWDACKGMLTPREEQALAKNIQAFLTGLPPATLPGDPAVFRRECLAELRAARKAGVVPGARIGVGAAAEEVRRFANYSDPQRRLNEERRHLAGLAGLIRDEGYARLAEFVALRPGQGEPLLAQASRYFFRRAVESDDKLSASLTLETIQNVGAAQQVGFDAIGAALDSHGQRIESLLADLHGAMMQTMEAATGTRDEVKALRGQLESQDQQLRHMASMLAQLLEQRPAPVTPAPTPAAIPVATPADDEWDRVRKLLTRCKTLSAGEQQAQPELARAISEFTATATRYETTRRTILNLEKTEETPAVLPVYPPSPTTPAAPKRPAGRLISPIFQNLSEAPVEQPPAEEAPPPKRKRLLSPLFDPPPDDAAVS